jgi:hypothetical protein
MGHALGDVLCYMRLRLQCWRDRLGSSLETKSTNSGVLLRMVHFTDPIGLQRKHRKSKGERQAPPWHGYSP